MSSPPAAPTGVDAQLHGGPPFDASTYDNNVYALSLVPGVRWPSLPGAPDCTSMTRSRPI